MVCISPERIAPRHRRKQLANQNFFRLGCWTVLPPIKAKHFATLSVLPHLHLPEMIIGFKRSYIYSQN